MRRPQQCILGMILAVSVWLLAGCSPLPSLQGRTESVALAATANTQLGRSIQPLAKAHPGKSGVAALADGRDAFAARVRLAEAAQRTLDIQYYIWHNDRSGILLFEALHRAADRGVRVRLLLDDNNTAGMDAIIAALDAHPNIEVRLFNPFMHRQWRIFEYATDFSRLNRRMHNKSFTADNEATIIGGRNIGDEYFDADQDLSFIDLDVLAIGPVVRQVSVDFDRYWKSDSSYPSDRVVPPVDQTEISRLTASAALVEHDSAASAYMRAITRQSFVRDLLAGRLSLEWAVTSMVSDDPAKGLGNASDGEMLPQRLNRILGTPSHELQLVSPYFVPDREGLDYLASLVRQGVKVTVLTNSLEATDVVAVHAGYAKWRIALLNAGIQLYETKRMSSEPAGQRRRLIGRSGSSLHAKTVSIDRSRVVVGSFNFDPRSARFNTEMGFVIDSPTMAQAIFEAFGRNIPDRAYKVTLSNTGSLQWMERRDGQVIMHDREPGTGVLLRLGVSFISIFPIDWLL